MTFSTSLTAPQKGTELWISFSQAKSPIATAKVSVPEVGQAPTVEEVVAEVAEASLANPEVISEDVTAVATDEAKADAPTKG